MPSTTPLRQNKKKKGYSQLATEDGDDPEESLHFVASPTPKDLADAQGLAALREARREARLCTRLTASWQVGMLRKGYKCTLDAGQCSFPSAILFCGFVANCI